MFHEKIFIFKGADGFKGTDGFMETEGFKVGANMLQRGIKEAEGLKGTEVFNTINTKLEIHTTTRNTN